MQPQCGFYLFLYLLIFIIYRFGECQPTDYPRIARLHARYAPLQFVIAIVQ